MRRIVTILAGAALALALVGPAVAGATDKASNSDATITAQGYHGGHGHGGYHDGGPAPPGHHPRGPPGYRPDRAGAAEAFGTSGPRGWAGGGGGPPPAALASPVRRWRRPTAAWRCRPRPDPNRSGPRRCRRRGPREAGRSRPASG